jgi:hypothetical protein
MIEYIVPYHHAVPSNGWCQCVGRNLEGIADVTIERVIDHTIGVNAFLVVIFDCN